MTRRIIIAALLLAGCVAHAETDDEWDTAIGQVEQVTRGLVAYWAMRNDGTTVYDEIGANNGTAAGGVTFGTEHAAVGFGASFDGTNDYISASGTGSLDITGNAITVSAWANPISVKGQVLCGKPHTATHTDPYFKWVLYFSSTRQWQMRIDSTLAWSGSGNLYSTNSWNHYAGVYNGNTISLYFNGAFLVSAAKTGNVQSSVQSVLIGCNVVNNEVFDGNLDEVRVYNRALTADEIKQLYRMGALPRGIK